MRYMACLSVVWHAIYFEFDLISVIIVCGQESMVYIIIAENASHILWVNAQDTVS